MINVLYTMFAYPAGIVLGNLIASAITGVLALVYHRWKFRRLHARIDAMEDRYQTVIKKLETRSPEE